ncbi:copper resistance CopC family protein [Nocardioides terrigena]|uniref:copper resistance CopC family protein n=1 Tax=Nocardioides terrigena TaxID=424797 RepID=UPI00131ED90C|nr:copper resistance CopC family protein [Nocardioides terrigena]
MQDTRDAAAGRTAVLLAVLLAVLVLGARPAPAGAHTDLVSSIPAQGERVSQGLDRVELVFAEDLLAAGAAIAVRGPAGEEVAVGATGTSGSTAAARLTLSAPGNHTLTYRVVGGDGHVISGSLGFTVVAGATPGRVATSVSREALPGASAEADAPGSVMWLLLVAVLLVAVALHRVAVLTRGKARAATSSSGPRDEPGTGAPRAG